LRKNKKAGVSLVLGERGIIMRKSDLSDADVRALTARVMKKQAGLSIRIALVFLVIILVLPLINWLAPSLAQTPVMGFSLTWLVLGVLFYPLTWVLSGYFVSASNKIETQIAKEEEANLSTAGGNH
jgi:uncharacterized membrane protein (DUF485 family)